MEVVKFNSFLPPIRLKISPIIIYQAIRIFTTAYLCKTKE
jgi:hypothetical protein